MDVDVGYVSVGGGGQKVACGFCVVSKKLQSNEKESFEKPTWPRSMLHKSNGQLSLPAES